jgi:hypothetical protein
MGKSPGKSCRCNQGMPAVARTAARSRIAAPPAPSRLALWLHQLYQPGILFPTALAVGLIVTWPYLPRWAPDLSREAAYLVSADRLRLPEHHEWIPEDFAEGILVRAGATPERPLSLLMDRLPERISHSLALDPWVESVRQVRQDRDGTIRADVTFRRPVLMIATPRGMYAVDEQGVLLPPEDFSAEDIRRFPIARGIATLPRGGAGETWDVPGLREAARLAAVLAPDQKETDPWRTLGLAAILVPSPSRSGAGPLTFELLTAGGSRIVWGHAPGTDSLEPPAAQKIARLIYYREQCGGFETAQGPSRIDIRDIEVIYAGALDEARR